MMLLIVRTIHILAAIWFTSGVAAYFIARRAVLRADDVVAIDALVRLITRFKNLMIRPGGILLLIFGLWAAYYEGWPEFSIHALTLLIVFIPFMYLIIRGLHRLEAASAEALKTGSITQGLQDALNDRSYKIGETGVGIIVVLFLLVMLIK